MKYLNRLLYTLVLVVFIGVSSLSAFSNDNDVSVIDESPITLEKTPTQLKQLKNLDLSTPVGIVDDATDFQN